MTGEKNKMHRSRREYPQEVKDKQSRTIRMAIKEGRFTPNTNNRYRRVWFRGRSYRSSWEVVHQIVHADAQYEALRIEMDDGRIVIPDFINHTNRTVTEIKPKKLLLSPKYASKRKSVVDWCERNGYLYVEETEEDVSRYLIPEVMSLLDDDLKRKLKGLIR
jgi:hypothetical protein